MPHMPRLGVKFTNINQHRFQKVFVKGLGNREPSRTDDLQATIATLQPNSKEKNKTKQMGSLIPIQTSPG